jgi:molecular chaperone DnaK
MALGIDLGTTNSVVATVGADGRPVVVANAEGERLTPSLVGFLDGSVVAGEPARELQQTGRGEVAAFFKRFMGEPDWTFVGGGVAHDATALSSILLEKLKGDAQAALGRPAGPAVITVPAYFMNAQRGATRVAAERAGLEIIQLVNEPTAAAIAYGFAHGRANAGKRLLVYDLGGGTFDVSLVQIGADSEEVVRSDGDHQLGGKDCDDRLARLLALRLMEDQGIDIYDDPSGAAELSLAAERAKRQLSVHARTKAPIYAHGRTYLIDVNRAEFEEVIADLIDRTDLLVRRVLSEAGMTASGLDGVVAVGGSTRMPMVSAYLRALTGHAPLAGINVDEAVAMGAAILAERREATGPADRRGGAAAMPRRIFDVTNHSLGMIAIDEGADRYINSVILPKGARLPTTQTRPYRFHTRASGGNRLEIFVTQGEHEAPDQVDYVGRYVVEDVPDDGSGGCVIDIAYAYDDSGEVRVSADVRGGRRLELHKEPAPDDVPGRFMIPPAKGGGALSVMLVFDLSGSMSGEPLDAAKAAARGFVAGLDITSTAIGVAAVADRTKVLLEPVKNARTVLEAIAGLSAGDVGWGNSAHPFDMPWTRLPQSKGTPVMVVLADGAWGDEEQAIAAAKRCHAQGLAIVSIGFGDANETFLAAIASTDGASFFTDLAGLACAFQNIAQMLTEGGLAVHPS